MFNTKSRMGHIDLTDSFDVVKTIPGDVAKIISMDEDGKLNQKLKNVVVGTVLLPPPECLLAEADGDEDLYDINYVAYLNSPIAQDFVAVIISALYSGINLLIFAPQLNENLSITKFMQFMWSLYGIGIGVLGKTSCCYDDRCIPIWINTVYNVNVIDAERYIKDYPPKAPIPSFIMDKLILEIKPMGKTYEEMMNSIERFRYRYNVVKGGNKALKMPLYNLEV